MTVDVKFKKLDPCFEKGKRVDVKPKSLSDTEVKKVISIISAAELIRNSVSNNYGTTGSFCK